MCITFFEEMSPGELENYSDPPQITSHEAKKAGSRLDFGSYFDNLSMVWSVPYEHVDSDGAVTFAA